MFKITIEKAGSLGDAATLLRVLLNLIVRSYYLSREGSDNQSHLTADLAQ